LNSRHSAQSADYLSMQGVEQMAEKQWRAWDRWGQYSDKWNLQTFLCTGSLKIS